MTDEVVLGRTYTDRFKKVSGPAMDVNASAGGCFLIGIQMPPKDGLAGPIIYCFDTHLDDENGQPVRVSDAMAERAAELMGHTFRHLTSGLTGMAEGVRFMENGTEQVSIQPPGDGKKIPQSWFIDTNLLEEIVAPAPVAGASVGAPHSHSPRF